MRFKIGDLVCACLKGKHQKTWRGIISRVGESWYLIDFPNNRPPTHDTGRWDDTDVHVIKNNMESDKRR